jgi:conjugal transfer/type IV secretion protein DotA/TraY
MKPYIGMFVILALLLFAALTPATADAASTGLSAVPHVDVQEGDLSYKLLSKLFGPDWANLASGAAGGNAGGDAPSLIFKLLKTLNSVCAVVVAWLVIFTTLVGAVGAAHEGKALAGRHASPWVPIRFAFSFSAIAPVFAGLNAMQILILAAIGMSINLANEMWTTGLDYVAQYGTINADISKSGIKRSSPTLAVGALEMMGMAQYLRIQASCDDKTGNPTEWHSRSAKGDDGKITRKEYYFTLTPPTTCYRGAAKGKTNLAYGDLGGFSFPATDSSVPNAESIDYLKMSAIFKLIEDIMPAATKLGRRKFVLDEDYWTVHDAAEKYVANMSKISAYLGQEAVRKAGRDEVLKELSASGKDMGWFMAGSYYWVLVEANNKTLKAMNDNVTFQRPDIPTLNSINLVRHDWISHGAANIRDVTNRLGDGLTEYDRRGKGAIKNTGDNFDKFWDWLGFVSEAPARFVANLSKDSSDAVLTYSKASRWITNGLEGAVLAAFATTYGGTTLAETAGGFMSDAPFVGGAIKGFTGGVTRSLTALFWVFLLCVAPLYLIFWGFGWIIPAIPFLTWVACLVGWLVLSVEAVIAAPIWLVGHCMPEGDGFAGASGRNGYALFLSVMLRPVLLVLSLFVCMALMCATGDLIHMLFKPYLDATGISLGNFGMGGAIALMVVLGLAITVLTWKMFELTTAMPDRIIRWVGQLLANLGDEGRGMAEQSVGKAQGSGDRLMGAGAQSFRSGLHNKQQGQRGGVKGQEFARQASGGSGNTGVDPEEGQFAASNNTQPYS